MIFECPGSQKFKHPQPENVTCPFCGKDVEIWTDEAEGTCDNCKNKVRRKEGQNCLDWCKYAKECVGEDKYDKYMKSKSDGKKEKGA
ncbi:MAG: hypothetical protein WC592_08275 [Candidatus Omnitrophota bacterium]|nr:hypothetical protein [Candidatus Omnitrophota bacterium]